LILSKKLKNNLFYTLEDLKWNNLGKDLIDKIKNDKRISLEYNYAFP